MTQQGRFSVTRFIDRLDECFARNDFGAAKECLEFWENEARKLRDDAGLLTVLNEETGFFRRSGEETRAMKALAESLELTEKLGLTRDISGATVYLNAATALSAFGRVEEAAGLYEKAAEIFKSENKTETYEYAALLNNRAAAYYALKRTDEAKADWRCAIEVLKKVGYHAGDIAVSLSMLAERCGSFPNQSRCFDLDFLCAARQTETRFAGLSV